MNFDEEVGESSSPSRSYGSFGGGGSGGGGNDAIKNDVYNRLMENGNEEAISNPDFREQLEAHFNRLPPRSVCLCVCVCVKMYKQSVRTLVELNSSI